MISDSTYKIKVAGTDFIESGDTSGKETILIGNHVSHSLSYTNMSSNTC